MTLLDAPAFNEARDRFRRKVVWGSAGGVLVLIVIFWFVAGRPADWPWNWTEHLMARHTVDRFLTAVEKDDLETAYGIWIHDRDWRQHVDQFKAHPYEAFLKEQGYTGKPESLDREAAKKFSAQYGKSVHDKNWRIHRDTLSRYTFGRFIGDWSSSSPDNEYGVIQSHKIAAERRYGNGVLVAALINGRKSKALNLDYDPHDKSLSFAPPDVELYLGP